MPLAIAMAVLAIAIPTCQMVGCSMDMGAMPMSMGGVSFTNTCDGTWVTSSSPVGIVPSGLGTLIFSLVAALFVAATILAPRAAMRTVVVHRAEPPPPPQDPRGERILI